MKETYKVLTLLLLMSTLTCLGQTFPKVCQTSEKDTIVDIPYRWLVNSNKMAELAKKNEQDAFAYKMAYDSLYTVFLLEQSIRKTAEERSILFQKQYFLAEDKADFCEQRFLTAGKKAKKEKRKAFWRGFGWGLGAGILSTAVGATAIVLKRK